MSALTHAEEAFIRSAEGQLRAGDAAGAVAKLVALTDTCVSEGACKLMLRGAESLGDERAAAYALKLLCDCEEQQGDYAAAVTYLEKATEKLAACGPPAAEGRDAAPWAQQLQLPRLLNALSELHGLRGSSAGAIRANAAVLDCGWPDSLVDGISHAMNACCNLVVLHGEMGDKPKSQARLRQWRELLTAAGVGVPSDTYAYARYALTALGPQPERRSAEEVLTIARRVHAAGCPQSLLPTVLASAANACRFAGDAAAAIAHLEEAVALHRAQAARAAAGGDDALVSRGLLVRALVQLSHARLGPTPEEARVAPVAAKSAALRDLVDAAGFYQKGEVTQEYARVLMLLEQAIQFDPATEAVQDLPVPLPSGRSVRLGEPDGTGRIALWEEVIGMLVHMHGIESPRLIDPLTEFTRVLSRFSDLKQLAHVTAWLARLTAATMGPTHQVARAAAENAAAVQENLGVVVVHIRSSMGARFGLDLGAGAEPDGATVKRAAAEMLSSGAFGNFGRTAIENKIRQDAHGERARAAALKVTKRLETPCAGCGALKPASAQPFKLCSICRAVCYCTRECQKAHWKKHKRDCATLAATAQAEDGADGGAAGAEE